MPASTVALNVVANPTPLSSGYTSQTSTAAGNSFVNDGSVMLLCWNQTASAKTLTFYVDRFGAERTLCTATLQANTSENGVALFGPFDQSIFNDHSVTDAAKTGHVMFSHSGSNADILICPISFRRK